MRKNQKIFASIILIAVVAIAGYFALSKKSTPADQGVSTPVTTNETAGWKTYTNPQYGFEFKYPTDYQLTDKLEKQGFYDYQISRIADVTHKEHYIDYASFTVYADNNAFNKSTCLTNYWGDQKNAENLTQTKIVNGNKFYVVQDKQPDSAMGGQRGQVSQYRILHNDYCYMLYLLLPWHEIGYGAVTNGGIDATAEEKESQGQAIQKNGEMLDRILSTFKFIEPITSPSITVLSPKLGDVLVVGKTYTINWKSSGLGNQNLLIDLDRIENNSKFNVVRSLTPETANTGSYSWVVDASIPNGKSYSIRVYTSENIGTTLPVAGASSEVFSITSNIASEEQKIIADSKEVVSALQSRDYQKLEGLVSSEGLSISFYPNFDPASKNIIPKNEVSKVTTDTKLYLWGYTDGKGDPINLTRAQALTQSNTVDYLKAPDIAVNKILGSGNSVNTIDKDTKWRMYVAFHFSGFNPEYEGMDWTTLYLVFDKENGEYKLRGIAKDNWTI